MTSARLHRAAVAYCRALMAEFGVAPDELRESRLPSAAPARPPAGQAPRPTPPARPPAAATAAVAPPQAPAKARGRPVPPKGIEPTVRIAPAAPPAIDGKTVVTDRTIFTVCPSARFDPRYQLDPDKPVEGAGLVADWRRRRGDK